MSGSVGRWKQRFCGVVLCVSFVANLTTQVAWAGGGPHFNSCKPWCDAYNFYVGLPGGGGSGKRDGNQSAFLGAQIDHDHPELGLASGSSGGPSGFGLSSGRPASVAACHSACPSPTPDRSPDPGTACNHRCDDLSNIAGGEGEACNSKLVSYTQIGPHCEAVRLADMAMGIQAKAIALYTTAAAVCGSACAAYHNRNVTLSAEAAAANATLVESTVWCTATNMGGPMSSTCSAACAKAVKATTHADTLANKAAATSVTPDADTTATLTVSDAVAAATAWKAASVAWGLANTDCAGGVTGPVAHSTAVADGWAAAATSGTLYNMLRYSCVGVEVVAGLNDFASFRNMKDAGQKSTETVMTGLGAAAATGGALFVGAVSSPNFIATCGLTAMSVAIAAQRYYSFSEAQKTAKKSCGEVKENITQNYTKLVGLSCAPPMPSPGVSAPPPASLPGGTGAGTRGSTARRQGSTPGGPAADEGEDLDLESPEMMSATAGDDVAPALNRGGLDKGAKELGLDPRAIANQIAAGATPSSILGGLSGPGGASLGLGEAMKSMEDLAASGGLFQDSYVAGTSYSGGGGGARLGGAKAPAFSMASKQGAAKPGEIAFGAPGKPEYDPNDIWHMGYKGSIFSLITRKLETKRKAVYELEYSIPWNKAMATNPNAGLAPPTGPQKLTRPGTGTPDNPAK